MKIHFAMAGAAVLSLSTLAAADVTFTLDSAPVFGPDFVPFLAFETELGVDPATSIEWDLTYTTVFPTTTGDQLLIDVVGPGGQLVDLDGAGVLGFPATPGVFFSAGEMPLSGFATGLWSLVVSDSVQDGPMTLPEGLLSGTITVHTGTIPAPGAIALLGVAGLCTGRRRRRG